MRDIKCSRAVLLGSARGVQHRRAHARCGRRVCENLPRVEPEAKSRTREREGAISRDAVSMDRNALFGNSNLESGIQSEAYKDKSGRYAETRFLGAPVASPF